MQPSSPPSLLQRILNDKDLVPLLWYRLQTQENQLALRCTSRAARQATTPLIKRLRICIKNDELGSWAGDRGEVAQSMCEFVFFPAAATLTELIWSSGRPRDDRDSTLHALLPSFFHVARNRLAALRRLELSAPAVTIDYGATSSIVDACPQLQRLNICCMRVVGPAFSPLSRLTGLHAIQLLEASVPLPSAYTGASLASLTSLDQLSIISHDKFNALGFNHSTVLPLLSGLSSLRHLELNLDVADPPNLSSLLHLSNLTALTSLLWKAYALHAEATASVPAEVWSRVFASSQLVKLHLPYTVLGTGAIKVLAALPHLSELQADALEPDADCNAARCSWRELALRRFPSLRQLLLLPLNSVTRLTGDEAISWTLVCGDDSTYAALERAAQILSRMQVVAFTCASSYIMTYRDFTLGLRWDSAPASSCHRFLAALEPLGHNARLTLELDHHWDVSEQHVEELVRCMPGLTDLAVWADGPSFATFAAAAAARMTRLQRLDISASSDTDACTEDALLSLAQIRAGNGHALKVVIIMVRGAEQMVSRCNKAVEAIRGSNRGRVAFYSVDPMGSL